MTSSHTHQYYLFGSPISQSLSPKIHNTGFSLVGLSGTHHYQLFESTSPEQIEAVLASATFAGASVTIPLKTHVGRLCGKVTESARAIGAINTLTRSGEDGMIIGDNTDWLGIERPLARALAGDAGILRGAVMLVLGAGGTARAAVLAARELGLGGVVIANRTEANARSLCEELTQSLGIPCATYQGPSAHGLIACVVSTLPLTAACPLTDVDLDAILSTSPAVLDVVYRPRTTALLERAKGFGCKTVEGVDMLVAQAIEQFKRFVPQCQSPPAREMEKAALDAYSCL